MPIKELIKGNRLEDIKDENGTVIGYRIHTGLPGAETADASYSGDARVLEFTFAEYKRLRKHPQGVCDSDWSWPAWLLTYDAPEESGTSPRQFICYPVEEGRPMLLDAPCAASPPNPANPQNDPSRPGSFWRRKGK